MQEFLIHHSVVISSIVLAALAAFFRKKLDLFGAFAGALIAILVWIGGGFSALFSLFTFFILGTLASSWGKRKKEQYNLSQENDGKRGIANVIANGSVAAFVSIFSIMYPQYKDIVQMAIIASFATACSDTLSSELGNIYGKKYFNILNFHPAPRGIDGAISLEGLAFGVLGSVSVSSIALLAWQDVSIFAMIVLSGFLGNITDSILGSTLQRRGYLNNHHVNFWATLFGVLFFLTFYRLF